MKTTTFHYHNATVNIHDPAETEEDRKQQHERLKKASVQFLKAKMRSEARKNENRL